jgi:hypothetical protein
MLGAFYRKQKQAKTALRRHKHTLILDHLVPVLIHRLHHILEHIVGIFQSWTQISYSESADWTEDYLR